LAKLLGIKAPLLVQGQTICLLGEGAALGHWNTQPPILLSRASDEDYFSVQLDLRGQPFPFAYKYGVFDVEMFSCQFGHAKPDPEIYLECLRRLDAAPGECLFVGDGGHGELRGARAVGIQTVLFSGVIQHTWPERIPALLADADFHISSLDQLFSLPPLAN